MIVNGVVVASYFPLSYSVSITSDSAFPSKNAGLNANMISGIPASHCGTFRPIASSHVSGFGIHCDKRQEERILASSTPHSYGEESSHINTALGPENKTRCG